LASYDKALAINPDYAQAHNNRGIALQYLRRFDEALASYERALAIDPAYPDALNGRGVALRDLKRYEEALASYGKALSLNPNYAEALNNRGITLIDLKRSGEALASLDQALAIKPDYAEALNNRGIALQGLKRFADALVSYDKALALEPDHARALNNRGITLFELKRPVEALASYDKALAIKPDYAEALNNCGIALQDLKRFADALASYDKALAIKPDYAEAFYNRGVTLHQQKRYAQAGASYERALASKPDHSFAFSALADSVLQMCDWARIAELDGELRDHVEKRRSIISPLTLLGHSSDALLHFKCAGSFIENKIPVMPKPLCSGMINQHEKIRIAYLSADFRHHAVASLIVELIELHDRTRFEVLGISYGADDGSEMRARLVKSFDQFHDIRSKTNREAAKLVNDLQVDIAVDLAGHTQDSRTEILAYRPAPIQINYLGYPGTTGAPFIDYVIADAIVLPFDQQPFYSEKIIHLPNCYQANDSLRKVADRTPSRREVGLPEEGFVFCCFNNNYKLTAAVFDVWMRLLHAVKGSVLWLLQDNADAQSNLQRQTAARAIDPARLVFAGRLASEDHLARYRLADLFLDTLPYGAHTTGSDALWAGLPLLTCRGETFAGRVGASLLDAIGLPELVTGNLVSNAIRNCPLCVMKNCPQPGFIVSVEG
jgi:predicted O-linked N-acetylglucosamine transferase (SPINDLY family)